MSRTIMKKDYDMPKEIFDSAFDKFIKYYNFKNTKNKAYIGKDNVYQGYNVRGQQGMEFLEIQYDENGLTLETWMNTSWLGIFGTVKETALDEVRYGVAYLKIFSKRISSLLLYLDSIQEAYTNQNITPEEIPAYKMQKGAKSGHGKSKTSPLALIIGIVLLWTIFGIIALLNYM